MTTGQQQIDNKWTKNGFGETLHKASGNGKFSKEESEQVRHSVLEYCAAKQIDVNRLCSECEHKAELKGAWMEISKALPHRSVQSVYRHGLRILHPFRRGAWSEEELNKLFELVTRLGKKWVVIQNTLHRSADSCRDKYRECSQDFVKGRWKEDEIAALEQLIREHIKADPKATLLDIGKTVEAEGISLPWESISKKMVKRSRLSCFKKFQKICGLFVYPGAEERIRKRKSNVLQDDDPAAQLDLGDGDMYLLSELAQSGAARSSEVSWETIRMDEAKERWTMLIMEWQQQEGEEATDEALTSLPVCQIAQLLLDRKNSAMTAAETLEAVDLPEV